MVHDVAAVAIIPPLLSVCISWIDKGNAESQGD